ncbi:sorting nexin-19-like isoform X2 [Nerophis ophidion]|uniref:sorting nexin-19-like isoform X2 n=1 Tax=Nerophis ophidion TaxID=159077 RepID=UPI002AE0109C|nr:sorting nexin-19-like isoform X2 [Nerophis ophidion]
MAEIPSTEEDKHDLDQEIYNTVGKIIRDFVSSWYSTVSSESGFEKEVEEAMISMGIELKMRAKQLDRKGLTQRILELFGCHLQDYLRARDLVIQQQVSSRRSNNSKKLWMAYSGITTTHFVMTSEAAEVDYTRAMVDLLLHVLVPRPYLETRTGQFVVGELITCNVLLPLFDKLSDPDWLNLLVMEIFGRSTKAKAMNGEERVNSSLAPTPTEIKLTLSQETTLAFQNNTDVCLPKAQTETGTHADMAMHELAVFDRDESEIVDCQKTNTEDETIHLFSRNLVRRSKSNLFYQEHDSDLDSPLSDYKQSSIDSLVMIGQEESFYDQQKICGTSVDSNNSNDLEDVCFIQEGGSCLRGANSETLEYLNDPMEKSAESTPIGSLQNLESEGSFASTTLVGEFPLVVEPPGNTNEGIVMSPVPGSSPLPSFSFEPLISPDGPIIIQNLRIAGTVTAKEHRGTGSHPYTLYTIKYETAMSCEATVQIQPCSEDGNTLHIGFESSSSIQPVAYHMVNRRYSEFLNLQTRVEEKTDLKKLIKGVKGPKKIFPDMPFGNMDSDKIEARKGMLETYLKHLCAIPEIANSEQMQEFLALNTDARIAFVKKPFIVSRIDKIVMNAIVDTLKTAFPHSEPQSPTEENEGEVILDKKSKSRLKFSSRSIPFMNGSDIRLPVLFSSEQTHTMFNGMSMEDLQSFISKQEKLSITLLPTCGDDSKVTQRGHSWHECSTGSQRHAETALADIALNILCLLMREQWSWLCTENIQRTIRLLFGTLINRWLDVSVANLTSVRYWVHYLQVIQESVWPGGVLPNSPQTERSQRQKDDTKNQVLYCLMGLMPDLFSDLLGSNKYKLSWQIVLESFQDPYINRHLVYCLCDLLLEFLVPELPEQSFQRSLLQSPAKNPEKLLA